FDPLRPEPSLLRAGDRVTFRRIPDEQFEVLARAPAHRTRGEDGRGRPASDEGGRTAQARAPASGRRTDVLCAGMYTSVQDLGRRGHRAHGEPLSGAVDPLALRVANLLVGNREDEAVL